jgi:serine/threonine protein kinase
LLNDLLDARARGDEVGETKLRVADPELAAELRDYLQLVGELGNAPANLETLIAQGILTRSSDPRYAAELGRYRIIEYLGRGGMGIVLKAYEESLSRTVALKILRPDLAGDALALARFTREAKAAAALQHPNIVTVHAIGEERGVHYIAMEYVAGPTLTDVIRARSASEGIVASGASPDDVAPDVSLEDVASAPRGRREPVAAVVPPADVASGASPDEVASGLRPRRTVASGLRTGRIVHADPPPTGAPLSTETIRHIFRQLLEALAAAHEAGLIHRDVKSSNVLVEARGLRDSGIKGSRDQEIKGPRNRVRAERRRPLRRFVASWLRRYRRSSSQTSAWRGC